MTPLRKAAFVFVALALTAFIAACGDGAGQQDAGEPEAGEQETGMQAPAQADTATAGGAQAGPVQVTLTDFDIDMPETLPAGQTEFAVENAGQSEHNFEVEGQGIEEEFENNLQPGDADTLSVDLQSGEYEVYCPVGDHQSRGMETSLTVNQQSGGATGSS